MALSTAVYLVSRLSKPLRAQCQRTEGSLSGGTGALGDGGTGSPTCRARRLGPSRVLERNRAVTLMTVLAKLSRACAPACGQVVRR